MQPGQYNFTLYQGTNDGLTFVVKNNGVTLDLTGYTAEMQIRRDYDKPPVLSASTALGNIVITPLSGLVQVFFSPSDTTPIRFSGESMDTVYAVELFAPSGAVTRILEGTITISRAVVRG